MRALLVLLPSLAHAEPHRVALQLHVGADAPIDDWIAAANRHFAPADIEFFVAGRDDDAPPSVATRADRDALRVHGKGINIFVTGRVDNIDEPDAFVYGVRWRDYIIISDAALERTLAHELAHYYGLPHSKYPRSIMNHDADETDGFSDEELAKLKRAASNLR